MKETDSKKETIDDKVLGQVAQNTKTMGGISQGNPFPFGTDLIGMLAGYNALVADSTKRGETRLAEFYGYVVNKLNVLVEKYFDQYGKVLQKYGEKYMKQFEEQKAQYAK